MKALAETAGIKVTRLTDDDQECHSCGNVGRPRYLIFLAHLCQHYVGLCGRCFRKMVEALVSVRRIH